MRWKLAADYPLTAPAYSSERPEMAKRLELATSGHWLKTASSRAAAGDG
jgi:predicted transcriptional regulator